MQSYTFEKYSQEEIIHGIKSNDPKILRVFYSSQYKKVEQYVLANNGTSDDAKDIYQEAFVVLWKKVKSDRFQPENGTAISGYLYQIAKNKWLDKLRANKNKTTVEIHPNLSLENDLPNHDQEAQHQWVVKEFDNLGKNCKEVLRRFYFLKETMEQIALAFNWTAATARNNKYRCIQQLKEKWKTNTNKELE
ncbi:RNA polymerase sigma factor [Mongoliitalea daihaiensis]|uniref:RNA polymerase sigma factor n=1 Tax=Mongoliitalea daihaiensis TaxID=2782006 RepID=UPI001F3D8176|nr:sigma-70 family RNA polymerase sigma factor [Mongoliitalea daihaiensis]UJP65912.1 sigma-70 family RNA polymerase sigma factor [Mongoliitalea daihaiensis]